jgi:hypothetical protein
MDRPLHAALAYATRGWAVFPVHTILSGRCSCREVCAHPAKHPIARHGLHDATTDQRIIWGWWDRWPWANVAIATGAPSGLIVVDIDPAKDATQSLTRLQSLMGSLPPTLTATTGGGGWHLFFAHPGVEISNTAGRLPGVPDPLPGLDLRGDGGYVVAAPSRHASGRPYAWVDPAAALAAPPGWLRPAPRHAFPTSAPAPRPAPEGGGSRYGLAALARELSDVRAAPIGERNTRLNQAAFSLGMLAAGGELDQGLVEDELLAAAADVGLGEGEAKASIHSGLTAGGREPRRRPATPPPITAMRNQTTTKAHVPSPASSPRPSRSR